MSDKLRFMDVDERLGQNRKSEYLGVEDIDDDKEPILTIKAAWDGMVTLQKGKEFAEGIVFEESSVNGIKQVRPWIVNSTNRKTLRKLFGGAKQKDIAGRKIQLYIDHNVRDPQTGGKCDGIRIREFHPKEAAPVNLICADCKGSIISANGMTAERVSAYTTKKYSVPLCAQCATKRNEAVSTEPKEGATDGAE